ncbi:type II toxin-antitoxin system VapC family toxin [Trichothermofontia sp.]
MAARYVVDASVLGHYLDVDVYTTEANYLISGLARGDFLYIPEFCLLECANILWKHVRFDGLPQTDAEMILTDFLDLPFQIFPAHVLLSHALEIGLRYQLTVYDSFYVSLALDLNCPLVTVDARQAQAASASGVTLKPITDFTPS